MPNVGNVKMSKKGTCYNADVTVEGDQNNMVHEIKLTVPASSGQPFAEPETITLTYDKTIDDIRYFTSDVLNFSSNAVGYIYSMTAKMLTNSGQSLGSTTEPVEIEEVEVFA